jgi:hypothetical protein
MIPIAEEGIFVRLDGLEAVREIDGISAVDITAVPGSRLVPPPEGDRYLGFIFARARTPDDVETALRKAMTILRIEVE